MIIKLLKAIRKSNSVVDASRLIVKSTLESLSKTPIEVVNEIKFSELESLLSNERYTEISAGLFIKRIYSPEDLKSKWEKSLKQDILKVANFSKNMVLLIKTTPYVSFQMHYHSFNERVTALRGSFFSSDRVVKQGETELMPAGKVHLFYPNGTAFLAQLEKPGS